MRTAALIALTVLAVLSVEIWLVGGYLALDGVICPVPDHIWEKDYRAAPPCWEFWLNRYQTLLAAAGALLAAWIGASVVSRQTRQMDRHEHERRKRRRAALRTVMPLNLSSLTDYVRLSADYLKALHERVADGVLEPAHFMDLIRPEVPSQAVEHFVNFAELANKTELDYLSSLLSLIQVQSARVKSLETEVPRVSHSRYNLEEYILDAAKIQALVDRLFAYARRETDQIDVSLAWSSLRSPLRVMGFHEDWFPRLFETITRRDAEGISVLR